LRRRRKKARKASKNERIKRDRKWLLIALEAQTQKGKAGSPELVQLRNRLRSLGWEWKGNGGQRKQRAGG
jgi:hypothetical protein